MAISSAEATAQQAFAEHEHRDLLPGLDRIHRVALAASGLLAADFSIALLDTLDWIEQTLDPHAAWEEALLYPELDRRTGTPWTTRLMVDEHRQIHELARRLEKDHDRLQHEPSREERAEMIGHLFALEAVLRGHLEREERFLLPLLETPAPPPSGSRSSRP
ncbi:MAG: hemerythrin domain-containing protein [Chloroflexota bacterium]|nr:MAG: hemerythrin domain-containing protein [Chloroflexota bacterium]